MIAQDHPLGNDPDALFHLVANLQQFVRNAAEAGTRIDLVEQGILDRLLTLGRQALSAFLQSLGSGDRGEQITLPDGTTAQRLDQTHARTYRSLFGDFRLERICYGSREGQKITFVPLDNRLQLPASDYSYLLQKWNASLGVESSFAHVKGTIEEIFHVRQSVDSLEQNLRRMAESVEAFRQSRPLPEASEEGEVFVVSADGKGVVLRRASGDPLPKAHRNKGDKANKKRMAIVGAIYSVDRHERTAEEVVAALFREPRAPQSPPKVRPEPVGKHVWGRLSQAKDGSIDEPIDAVFGWLDAELERRNPAGRSSARQPVVCVMDGQAALWSGCDRHIEGVVVEVLDLLHVAPRLWQAAHVFHKEGTAEASAFVRERLLRVLQGEVRGVVKGLRRMGTERGLSESKKKSLRTITKYLQSNAERMRYDEYLRAGYPIASGVIEGACRHYVKDRMERAGMRWVKAGAQAMLDVRSEAINGNWDAFCAYRIDRETARLYPHRELVEEVAWPLAA
jgi:hypothetical protein